MICFILAFPVVIGVIIWASRAAGKAANEAWASAARQLRLAFQPGDFMKAFKIEGAIGGMHVTVETYAGGERKGVSTRFRVGFPKALGLGLRISRAGIFSAFARQLGGGGIVVGDPEFDNRFTVRGNDPDRVGGFLDGERRMAIGRFFTFHRDAVILDGGIESTVPGRVRDAGKIVGTVRSMADLAQRLSQAAEEPIAEAIVVEETPPPPPTDPRPRTTESPPSPPPPLPVVAAPLRQPADPFGDLFGEGMTSLDTNQKFDAAYKNTTVRWKGTLKHAETYSFDSTFGRDGAKAVVDVHEIPSGFHKGSKVQAIVQVPPESASELRDRIGSPVEIEGRLVQCDGFMRTLFVADGKVTG